MLHFYVFFLFLFCHILFYFFSFVISFRRFGWGKKLNFFSLALSVERGFLFRTALYCFSRWLYEPRASRAPEGYVEKAYSRLRRLARGPAIDIIFSEKPLAMYGARVQSIYNCLWMLWGICEYFECLWIFWMPVNILSVCKYFEYPRIFRLSVSTLSIYKFINICKYFDYPWVFWVSLNISTICEYLEYIWVFR